MDHSSYQDTNNASKNNSSCSNMPVGDIIHHDNDQPDTNQSGLGNLQNIEAGKSVPDNDLVSMDPIVQVYIVESDVHSSGNNLNQMSEFTSQVHGSPVLQESSDFNMQEESKIGDLKNDSVCIVKLPKRSLEVSPSHQVEGHKKQLIENDHHTNKEPLEQQKHQTPQEQLTQQTVLPLQSLQAQKSIGYISGNSYPPSSDFGMYQTLQQAHEGEQSVYLLSDKDNNEGQGTVLGQIYCSDLVGNGSRCVVTSASSACEPATVASSEYSLMSGFDNGLTHASNISHLSLPSLLHTSETDSEVALTLASLGDPKNDKFEHSFFHQNENNFQRREELPASLNIYSESLNGMCSESASFSSLPRTTLASGCANQLQGSCQIISKDDPIGPDATLIAQSFISVIPTTQPLETLAEENGTLERGDPIASTSRNGECRPTLVLRSRKGRGPSIPHQYHNFPDPEKIGKKKRKKDQKSKSSKFGQSESSSDLVRLPANQCQLAMPCLEPIKSQADLACTKSSSLICDVQENIKKSEIIGKVNGTDFLMHEHENFHQYSFQSECVEDSRKNNTSNGDNKVVSSCDRNHIIHALDVHDSFDNSHHSVVSAESSITSSPPINATSRDVSSLLHLKNQSVSTGVPMFLVHMPEGATIRGAESSPNSVVKQEDPSQVIRNSSMDKTSLPVTSLNSIASLTLNSSLLPVNSQSKTINVHVHPTDTHSSNTSIPTQNIHNSESVDASHSINSFSHQMVMPTQPFTPSTHSLNTSSHSIMTLAQPILAPTLPTNVPITTSSLSSQPKKTVTYCMSASVHPINSVSHQVTLPTSFLNQSTYHLSLPAHSDDIPTDAFGIESNSMANLMPPPNVPARAINSSGPSLVSARSSDMLWNRSEVTALCNETLSTAARQVRPVASEQQMAALTLAEIDVLESAVPSSTTTANHSNRNSLLSIPSHGYASGVVGTHQGSALHINDQTSILISPESSASAILNQSISPEAMTSRPSSSVAYHHQQQPTTTNGGGGSTSHFLSSSSGLFYTLPSSSYLTASPCLPAAASTASCGAVSPSSQPSNILIYSSHQDPDSAVGFPVTRNFNSELPCISSCVSEKDLYQATNSTTHTLASNNAKDFTNIGNKNSTEIVPDFPNNTCQNSCNQMLANSNNSNNTSSGLDIIHNPTVSVKDHNSYHIPNGSTHSSTPISCISSSNMVPFNSINEGVCHQDNTAPTSAVTSSPCLLLLPPLAANSEKENLMGQLLKASEHCEPASLIPAGVVNDVIPAVGYRILEVSNLSQMIRCMHSCSGSGELGTIVIQEQASLREGAVSQLSVICTACQEGTVCATSNRTSSNEGSSTTNNTGSSSTREDGSSSVGPWDINLRVQQLVHEFGISELQVQRMLEILGIFYRPNDPDSAEDVSNSTDEGPTPSEDSLYPPPPLPDMVTPTSSPGITSITITTSDCNGDEAESSLGEAAVEPVAHTSSQPVLKFEAIRNLSSCAAIVPQSAVIIGDDTSSGKRKRKRPGPKQATNSSSKQPPQPPLPKAKTLSCPSCSAKFVSLNHLKKHAQSHNLSQHTCPYCQSYFKKPYNLREHIKKHQNIKYSCDQCSRQFTDRSSLVVHRKSSHEMKYEFKCSECPKVFYKRVHFTDHMRLHTRETPFACEICGKRFIWRDSVKKHMDTHIAEAKYNCRLCGKWFRWLQGIRQHLQQQHKLKKCDVEAQVNTNGASTFYQKQPQSNRHQQKQRKQVPQHYQQEQLQVEIQLLQSGSPSTEQLLDDTVHKLPAIDSPLNQEPVEDRTLLAAGSGDGSDVMMRTVATRGCSAKWSAVSPDGKIGVQTGSPEIRLLLSSEQSVDSVVVTTLDSKDNREPVDTVGDEEMGHETNSDKLVAESVAGLSSGVGVW